MKYLRTFETEAAYSTYTQSEDWVTPNVCYCEEEREVMWNQYVAPPSTDLQEIIIKYYNDPIQGSLDLGWDSHLRGFKGFNVAYIPGDTSDTGVTWSFESSSTNVSLGAHNSSTAEIDVYRIDSGDIVTCTLTATSKVRPNISKSVSITIEGY